MIVLAIVALSAVVLGAIYTVLVGLPDFPVEVTSVIDQIAIYMQQGTKLLMSFVYPEVVSPLVTLLLSFIGVYEGYKFVMWVMKKIPLFGVSD